jgi:hypothetical protein
MNTPTFFDDVPPLRLFDPLAGVLGAASGDMLTYRYDDAVRLAGHSCPTVAGAWLLARHALGLLYPETTPVRGDITVQLREAQASGTAGVTGAVLGLITGAAGEGGFQGLSGRFSRRGLLAFGVAMTGDARLTRVDNGATVELSYQPQCVSPDPSMPSLMSMVLSGTASVAEREEFARLWQDRVRRILLESPEGLIRRIA